MNAPLVSEVILLLMERKKWTWKNQGNKNQVVVANRYTIQFCR